MIKQLLSIFVFTKYLPIDSSLKVKEYCFPFLPFTSMLDWILDASLVCRDINSWGGVEKISLNFLGN